MDFSAQSGSFCLYSINMMIKIKNVGFVVWDVFACVSRYSSENFMPNLANLWRQMAVEAAKTHENGQTKKDICQVALLPFNFLP